MNSERKVVMARKVAEAFLKQQLKPEYRMTVYGSSMDMRKIPGLLRSFRDQKIIIANVDPIPDLGVQEDFDSLIVWSSDRNALKTLEKWFEDRNMETTGIL